MSDLYVQATTAELLYTFDWTDVVPDTVTITDVEYTIPSGLSSFGSSPDFDNKKSTIGISGIAHAGLYPILARALLSNSEKVPKTLMVRGFFS